MSETAPRTSKYPQPPEAPKGYRSTRRGSKALKKAKKAERQFEAASRWSRFTRAVRNVVWVIAWGLAIVGFSAILLLLVATGINGFVRWNEQRLAEKAATPAGQEQAAKGNLLVIGTEGDKAVGFLAARYDSKGKQVFGIAIPDGAFIDVPGQGFQRVGDSYLAGPQTSLAAVSNFLGVPFRDYVVVPSAVYKDALTNQSVAGLPDAATDSSLSKAELEALAERLGTVKSENIALVPMPVKPLKLGEQTYFEPQRAEIADLLKQWWGVDITDTAATTRVIVYNGSGQPGIAGEAAQQLIRSGFRVVDTKNADRFDYAQTSIVVAHGDAKRGQDVARVLGVGKVTVEESSQDVTDIVIVIGKDYVPPKSGQGGTK